MLNREISKATAIKSATLGAKCHRHGMKIAIATAAAAGRERHLTYRRRRRRRRLQKERGV